jgi:hypothetical protein
MLDIYESQKTLNKKLKNLVDEYPHSNSDEDTDELMDEFKKRNSKF